MKTSNRKSKTDESKTYDRKTLGYAAFSPEQPLRGFTFERRKLGPEDVLIEIAYCGICHSDIHTVRGDWGPANYPVVPGHEIAGHVRGVGKRVRKFRVGDRVGVGCFVDSCRNCESCRSSEEQFCERGAAFTYNSTEMDRVTPTQGGYSTQIVVREPFVLKIPKGLSLERVAPLLCAGITTYSPLKRYRTRKGMKVGVVGLGGLGHMAVKFAHAFGAEVTVFSTSPSKAKDAKRLGAKHFVVTRDEQAMEKLPAKYDLILDTVSAPHDLNVLLSKLKKEGTLILVGVPTDPASIEAFSLIGGRKKLTGSLIGGIRETQEMLNFCAKKKVLADIELISPTEINTAYERTLKSDVKYRFVIDLSPLKT